MREPNPYLIFRQFATLPGLPLQSLSRCISIWFLQSFSCNAGKCILLCSRMGFLACTYIFSLFQFASFKIVNNMIHWHSNVIIVSSKVPEKQEITEPSNFARWINIIQVSQMRKSKHEILDKWSTCQEYTQQCHDRAETTSQIPIFQGVNGLA